MDRKDSIDRYMNAGPFSWPAIIAVLNQHYVPVKSKPDPQQQIELGLQPYVFIEPGFLILAPSGEMQLKLDRLTTLHPAWLKQVLFQEISQPLVEQTQSAVLEGLWQQFRAGQFEQMRFDSDWAGPDEEATEALLLEGMVDFRLGRHERAKQKWERASQHHPNHPLAWKAAAEAEGFGPFVRGFEVHRTVGAGAYRAGRGSAGSAAPRGTYTEGDIWGRSTEFLLGMQHENGSYTDCDYDFGGTDSLPNVHVAVTSLVGMALIESRRQLPPDSPWEQKIGSAIRRAAEYVAHDANLNRSDRDELLWALAYRVRFFARLANLERQYLIRLRSMVTDLELIQLKNGGWHHEYNNPFATATALLALHESASAGAPPRTEVVQSGANSLGRDRLGNGAFPYSSVPAGSKSSAGTDLEMAESAGRMPLCELAIWQIRKSSDQNLIDAVERSFGLNGHLIKALKYDDHTSNLSYAGFFFWYDIRARSEAIANLPDSETKTRFKKQQRDLVLSLPEIDGCFVDSHELGRVYGTAMALLSLADLRDRRFERGPEP
jgi:hypothetical protein